MTIEERAMESVGGSSTNKKKRKKREIAVQNEGNKGTNSFQPTPPWLRKERGGGSGRQRGEGERAPNGSD